MNDLEPRIAGQHRAGYWMIRRVKDGPEVPAMIQIVHTRFEPAEPSNIMPERSPFWIARIGFDYVPIDHVWLRKGRTITKDEYEYQMKLAAWARAHAPADPRAKPRESVTAETLRSLDNVMPPRRTGQ